jgi:hypothetical protein
VGEILVFAASEAVARHDDPAAKALVIIVGRGQRRAFLGREYGADQGTALHIEVRADLLPVERGEARFDGGRGRAGASGWGSAGHAARSRSSRARLRLNPHR